MNQHLREQLTRLFQFFCTGQNIVIAANVRIFLDMISKFVRFVFGLIKKTKTTTSAPMIELRKSTRKRTSPNRLTYY